MMDELLFVIELNKDAIFSTRKLFDMLTHNALLELGFSQEEVDSLGDLYSEVKGVVESIEISES
ncbi:MAG: hypothetical protein HRU18_09035 [Pseudoalteromonas sp.]|uniref:hypothetical protein n=1 Tax=Pseudoalteromonas sp. TaxID=53249 RepID=UPI001D1C5F4F|nr:hypothetical protein [Pseudoalteromonas sp.]NRA78342.1 hypothetical protein [Pseudoalteromonas sp.]